VAGAHADPGAGEIVTFNRSRDEDVLIQRVHKMVPKEVWSKRYDHINAFERMLAGGLRTHEHAVGALVCHPGRP